MSPNTFGQLGLSITGLGTQYPPYALKPDAIDTLAKRYHADSPSMKKVCAINQFTGIDTRSSIGNPDHPVVNHLGPPSIADLHDVFMNDGVPLAVSAARKAIAEASIDLDEIVSPASGCSQARLLLRTHGLRRLCLFRRECYADHHYRHILSQQHAQTAATQASIISSARGWASTTRSRRSSSTVLDVPAGWLH